MLSINLINILILFFTTLILYQSILAIFNVSEGFAVQQPAGQYKPYNDNDPAILSQQNAGNIQVLKQQINDLTPLKQEVQNINQTVATLKTQVQGIIGAHQQYAQSVAPKKTPKITGAT